jgi:hypothetical protein
MAMSESAKYMPLAFALALSLSASSAEALSNANTSSFFQPERLRDSLGSLAKTGLDPAENQPQAAPTRIAQWLNFCFSGAWRRC